MYKEILEYQEKDIEISKLLKDERIESNKKIINNSIITFKNMQNSIDKLSQDAEKQMTIYEKLKGNLKSIKEKVDALISSTDSEEAVTEKVLRDYLNQINKIQSNITFLKNNIERINKAFETAKIAAREVKQTHTMAKSKHEELLNSINKEVEVLKAQKKDIEKKISKDLLAKYNDAKNDNIMPVFVRLTETNSCGGCRQELAKSQLDKLKQNKILVCEHCRRYIIEEE